ncbi:MAG TPA: MBL fold metallo-hydrolase [Solirubrobacter sp.]|nr:MBL fold metallo-hydrolase [Solirubrobacter sp.]
MRRVTWLGHATVLLDIGGVRLLTDPVLRTRIMHLRRHVAPAADPGRLDAVLVSHVHYDHLDRPSLRRVAKPGVTAVLPTGAERFVTGMGFAAVRQLRAGETLDVAGLAVEAVPAWHDGRRRPGPGGTEHDTLGFLVDGIWFAGDTDLHDDMRALRGRVDVALIPIWGWGPSLGPGHLDPERAADAVALIRPRIAIPIHWGTFLPVGLGRRHGHLLSEPAELFAAQVAQRAPEVRVKTIPPGGSLGV